MAQPTVVIGIGHPYRNDDAVGLAVIEALAAQGPPHMALVSSTGEPTELIDAWSGVGTAIVVDALHHAAAEPGRIHQIEVDPRSTEPNLPSATSSHGVGLGHTIALARVLDRLPARLVIYAIEVTEVGFGDTLSAPVAVAARSVADHILASRD